MVQQSPDWERPIGGQTAWQRTDEVWSSQSGMARRVHRSIRQRDGVESTPAVFIDVKYELKEQGRPIGKTFDRYRLDIETAYLTAMEVSPLLKDPVRLGPEPFARRIILLNAQLELTEPATPYREAVLAVRRQLEAARRGETAGSLLVRPVATDSPAGPANPRPQPRP
jgi:hypothetical protein